MSIAEKLTTVAENQQNVYDAGKQSEYDRFWDTFQHNGNRTSYEFAFGGQGWGPETFKPKYDIRPKRCDYMFARMGIHKNTSPFSLVELLNDAGVTLDTSNSDTHIQMFFEAQYITDTPHIDLTKSNYATNLFSYCISMRKAEITVAPNTVPNTANWFNRCDSLEDLTIHGTLDKALSLSNSSKLTGASVQSVIDCLADLTGTTSQAISFHSDVLAKLTTVQADAISAKNWTF